MSLFRRNRPAQEGAGADRPGQDALRPGTSPDAGETTSWFQPVTGPAQPGTGRPAPYLPPAMPGGRTAAPGGPWPPQPPPAERRGPVPGPGAAAGPPPAGLVPGGPAPAVPPGYGAAALAAGTPPAGAPAAGGPPSAAPQGGPGAQAREPERRRANHRRPMRKGRRFVLRLLAAVIMTAAFLGARLMDELIRYEMMDPPPKIRNVPVGETVAAGHARWRLVSIERMPNPPPNTRPDRTWLTMRLEVTPVDKEGTNYRFGTPPMELHDDDGHTWHVEVLQRPEKDMVPGRTDEFTLVAVAPNHLADRVEPVLWVDGNTGSGLGLRFDR